MLFTECCNIFRVRSHFNINSEFRFVISIFVSKVEEGSPFYIIHEYLNILIISTFNMSTYKLVYLKYSNDCILSFNVCVFQYLKDMNKTSPCFFSREGPYLLTEGLCSFIFEVVRNQTFTILDKEKSK